MHEKTFKAEHINAVEEDLAGNNGIGRYVFLPGSDGRAKQIADHFSSVTVKESSRAHNLYLGEIEHEGTKIEVASVATGMGTPSVDIIMNELIKLGAKRFLRVGTAGLLQPEFMRLGDFVIGLGAVRDEGASRNYVPLEFPAIASPEMVQALVEAARELNFPEQCHVGLMHSKDSLFAREFGEGAMAESNHAYVNILRRAGVLASEMEASHLFTLSQLFDAQLRIKGKGCRYRILSGAICLMISDGPGFVSGEPLRQGIEKVIEITKRAFIH
ncbi:MAG: nucleoside phosphorylase, partial [Gammaproteobacteria bacterium]|nr:nucleoside phosphorylase [Gammaproteobacteria bacterium]